MEQKEQKIGGKSVRVIYDAKDSGWTAVAKTLGMSTEVAIRLATEIAIGKTGSAKND